MRKGISLGCYWIVCSIVVKGYFIIGGITNTCGREGHVPIQFNANSLIGKGQFILEEK